jgi:hypothetical protein
MVYFSFRLLTIHPTTTIKKKKPNPIQSIHASPVLGPSSASRRKKNMFRLQ